MDVNKLLWAMRGIRYKFSFAKFGNISYIGKPVSIVGKKNIFIGNKVRIYPGVRMEAFDGGKIIIEDNTSIAQNFNIIAAKESLRIGKNTTISGNVFVTNIDHEYREIGVHIMDQNHIISTTVIGENCFIGFGASIQAGTKLGRHCIVGTNAVVRGEYPDYCVLVGVPARVVKRYNTETKEWERV